MCLVCLVSSVSSVSTDDPHHSKQVDRHGIQPLVEKVDAVQQFSQPTSLKKLQQFLGLVNSYHRLIPGCAQILQPLNAMLTGTSNGDQCLVWTPDAKAAFIAIKEALADTTLLYPIYMGLV